MLRAAFLSLVALVVSARAIQVPLQSIQGGHSQGNPHSIPGVDDSTQWRLDEIPNPNATDHLVFETVYSLLQHWPNLRMRNGHNIVPGIVPEGTLLYHGTNHGKMPQGIEWVSFDFEHAYIYCQGQADLGSSQQGCWQLTLAATRPLKVVYFDGKSAAKIPGALDTQDLLAFGELHLDDISHDARLTKTLCKWGKNFGIDGFVRMEMAFEVFLCDFTSSVSTVSFSNIVQELGLPPDKSEEFVMFEAIKSGGRHNYFPGETRIQLDLAGLVSFYDTELVPSLVAVRAGQVRWDHRAQHVSENDLSAVVSRLEAALTRPLGLSSGINWKTLIQVIVDRYAGRLELTQYLVDSSTSSPDEILDLAVKIQTQLRIMLTPYLHLSAAPTEASDKNSMDWAIPVYRDCATAHTSFAASKLGSMTDSEKLLFRAVRRTNGEICRVVTKMWAAGVYAGIDPSLNTKDSVDITELTRVWKNIWAEDVNQLMAKLDWNVWIKCKPACGPEEICFLHTWPWVMPWVSSSQASKAYIAGRAARGRSGAMVKESFIEEPFRPQPKCISVVDP